MVAKVFISENPKRYKGRLSSKMKYQISDEKSLLDFNVVHTFLSNSYWAKDIPIITLKTAIDNSLCFGVYDDKQQQVGFARMITDQATFAYLADVFILPAHRQKGLSKKLVEYIQRHPSLQGLRRVVLVTADAHELYSQFNFSPLASPEKYMECWQPNVYQNQ